MTYLAFLFIFILPPIVLLALVQRLPLAGVGGIRAQATLPLICCLAIIYTTPWDNYLVYRGVWTYDASRIQATIGYVPVEEYAFFLLQPILTGLFLYALLSRIPQDMTTSLPSVSLPSVRVRHIGSFFFIAITVLGASLFWSGSSNTLYLGLILAWAGPVLFGLWFFAGDHLWRLRRLIVQAITWPTLYLWIADWVALKIGIWSISETYSLGFAPFDFPIEEATFFLMTNMLVVFGTVIFLHGHFIAKQRQIPQNQPQ